MVPFRKKKKKRKNGSPQLCLDPKNASNTAGLVGSGWYLLPVYLDVRLVKRLFSEQIPAGCLPSLHGAGGDGEWAGRGHLALASGPRAHVCRCF